MVMKLKASSMFHWPVFIFPEGEGSDLSQIILSILLSRDPVWAASVPSVTSRWSHRPVLVQCLGLGLGCATPLGLESVFGNLGVGGRKNTESRRVGAFSFSEGQNVGTSTLYQLQQQDVERNLEACRLGFQHC